jgi:hypothetical protein
LGKNHAPPAAPPPAWRTIADLGLTLHSGSPKGTWVNPGGGHTGRSSEWPDGKIFEKVVAPWIARQVGVAE